MDDREALFRAVIAEPDDDLPRLVFADWLEEHGDVDHAAFVRAQVELARTPAWEPFAVFCRHRRPDWAAGRDRRHTLPPTDPAVVEWHPDRAFRRGFGWSLVVRDLSLFLADAARLFDQAPIGELHLPTATLDEWKEFADQPWLPRVEGVHFYSLRTPIEAVRVLADAPGAAGVEEVVFETASRPGMPEVLAGLLRSPLGRRLKRLTIRNGPEAVDDLIDAFFDADPGVRLGSLTVSTAALYGQVMDRLLGSGPLGHLTELHLTSVPGGSQTIEHFAATAAGASLLALRVNGSSFVHFSGTSGLARIAESEYLTGLRLLDLSDQSLSYEDELRDRVAWSESLAGVRSLVLRKCMLGDESIRVMARARFWPNLTELDLRDNRVTDRGAEYLLAAPVPSDLTALLVGGNRITPEMAGRLREKFGDAVILD